MVERADSSEDIVALLIFGHDLCPDRTYEKDVFARGEFDIGRQIVREAFDVDEPTISAHHVRFRCVVFDDYSDLVLPLVYARVLSVNGALLVRHNSDTTVPLSEADGDVLLNHGDSLRLNACTSVTFREMIETKMTPSLRCHVRRVEANRLPDRYHLTERRLGTGAQATIFVAVERPSGRQLACKVVSMPFNKASLARMALESQEMAVERELNLHRKREELAREYNTLKGLCHPNIVTIEKVFCADNHTFIFQELITGGDLFAYIEAKRRLDEPQVAVIIYQILHAVEYLHEHNIVHRDIKPENVLMTSWRDGARVVLADFGQARKIDLAAPIADPSGICRMQSRVGTFGYIAPEIYHQIGAPKQQGKGYSKAVDIWSVGCVTVTMLSGEPPWGVEDDQAAVRDNTRKVWDLAFLERASWQSLGRKVKIFIRGCLEVDEAKRLTAKQAIVHPWFTNKHYAADLQAAYEHAIHGWKPRKTDQQLIEMIDTSDVLPTTLNYAGQGFFDDEIRSHHFLPPTVAGLAENGRGQSLEHLYENGTEHPGPLSENQMQLEESESPASIIENSFSLHPPPSLSPSLTQNYQNDHAQLSIAEFAPPGCTQDPAPMPPSAVAVCPSGSLAT